MVVWNGKAVELMKRGSRYILKLDSARICSTSDVGGERKK